MFKEIILLVSIIAISSAKAQGRVDGFLKGKGNLDVAISCAAEFNPKFIGNGNTFNITRNIFAGSAFVAYGITDKLDLNASVPYIRVNGNESGIQDGAIYFKYKVSSFKFKSSNKDKAIKGDLILAGGFSSNFTDYQTGGASALGQQAKSLDIRPVFQLYFPGSIFATIQTGFTYKFDPVPNAVPLAIKIGMAKSKYYFDVWYDFQHSFGGVDYPTSSDSFRMLGVDYHKVGGTFYKPIKNKFGIFVGASYTITGRNTAQGFGFNAGFVIKHNKKK